MTQFVPLTDLQERILDVLQEHNFRHLLTSNEVHRQLGMFYPEHSEVTRLKIVGNLRKLVNRGGAYCRRHRNRILYGSY